MSETNLLEDKLRSKFGDALVTVSKDYDFTVYEFRKAVIKNVIEFLKNNEGFIYLTTLCGSHFPDSEKEREFNMMYQLHNLVTNERIRLKTYMPREDMVLDSIVGIFDAANWMEREAYDFFGFEFKDHPKLIRILNMEEMNYFPMRKEYPLEDLTRNDKNDKFFGRD